MSETPEGATPAGWHRDPFDRLPWRFWDGERWTPYGSVDGTSVVVDADDRLAPPEPAEPDRHRALALLASTVLILLAVAVAIVLADGEERDEVARSASDRSGAASQRDRERDPVEPGRTGDRGRDPGEVVEGGSLSTRGDHESAWPAPSGPLKVVYDVESSDGSRSQRIVASDPPRSVQHLGTEIVYNDGTDVFHCTIDECRRIGPAEPGSDFLAMLTGSGPPASDEKPFTDRIAGREAVCTSWEPGPSTTCWDTETGVMLLLDPGEEAMRSAFTSTRMTAIYLGAPDPVDFELPHDVVPWEEGW